MIIYQTTIGARAQLRIDEMGSMKIQRDLFACSFSVFAYVSSLLHGNICGFSFRSITNLDISVFLFTPFSFWLCSSFHGCWVIAIRKLGVAGSISNRI